MCFLLNGDKAYLPIIQGNLCISYIFLLGFSMNSTEASTTRRPPTNKFNQDPTMETYEVIILLICYSIVSLAILTLNYLIVRAFSTTKPLLPRQRYLLSYLACTDLAVGLVSIPTFLYNMSRWPSNGFYIYEASDCASGLGSACILVSLSIQGLRSTFRPPTRYAGHPRRRNFFLVIAGTTVLAGCAVAVNMACLMDYISFTFYFYLVTGVIGVSVLVMVVTCIVVMVSQLCGKERESDRDEDKKVRRSMMKSCIVYILTWALPYLFLTYNKFCGFCIPVSAMFFYIIRILLYLKSFLMPIFYFYGIYSFHKAVKRILTHDCLGIPRKY